MKYILLLAFAASVSSCKAETIDFTGMKSLEKQFVERRRKELVAYMPLETMFPDRRVRELASAAAEGKYKKLEDLVAQGVDVNSKGEKGATPLFWALRNSNIEGFEKLLSLGANPNIIFADSSVMHWAARHEDIRFLQKALDHGGDPNLRAGKRGETPLFKTIGVKGEGNRPAMLILIGAGANIDAASDGVEILGKAMGGKTPVMVAAEVVRFDIVYDLLIRGADYQLKDVSGRSLMDRIASMNGRFDANSEQEIALNRVIDWLSERGVTIP